MDCGQLGNLPLRRLEADPDAAGRVPRRAARAGGFLCVGAGYWIFTLCEVGLAARGGMGGLLIVIDGVNTNRNYPASGSDPTDDYYFPLHDRLGNITENFGMPCDRQNKQ